MREVCEFILKSQGHWKTVMEYAETAHWPAVSKPPMLIKLYSGKGGK